MDNKKLVLGLDIGIASVGWGIINIENDEIIDCGVRLFPERNAKENQKRRAKRSSRRLLRRKGNRISDLKNLLKEEKIIDSNFKYLDDPYTLRAKGVRSKLENDELATAILHIAKRRGSVLDVIEDDEDKAKELGKAKSALTKNEKELNVNPDIYVCDVQLKRLEERGYIRGTDNIFKLESYIKEAKKILENSNINENTIKKITDIISRKREYYEGPGSRKSPTPYGRFIVGKNGEIEEIDLIEKMRGKCSIYPEEPRAPRMSYSAKLFNFLDDLNNLKIGDDKITTEQKQKIIEEFIKVKGNITINQLIKFLGLESEYDISGFKVDKSGNPFLTEFEGYKIIKKCVTDNELNQEIYLNTDYVDKIVEILTRVKGVDDRKKEIKEINPKLFDDKTLEKIANISGITGYHSLSMKAIKEFNKEMLETSLNQMEIIAKNSLMDNKSKKMKGLKNIPFDDSNINNPVVKRSQQEAIKVINAIRKQYGELDTIVIETAREKNSEEQRKNIADMQKIGEERNKSIKEIIGQYGVMYNAKLHNKVILYQEQETKCLYCGKQIDLDKMISDAFAYDIDHIIPLSISPDDSMNNKVVVHADCNRKKSNMTPFQYLSSGSSVGWSYNEFKSYVLALKNNNKKKKYNLLFKGDINKYSVALNFINRNLVDTRYASRLILNQLNNYYRINDIPTKVHTVRGQITDMFRKRARVIKDRDEYKHHAVDALIVAAIKKQKVLNQILETDYNKKSNIVTVKSTGEVITLENEKEFFDEKFINFISKLRNIEPKFSFKVDRKLNRQFTDETIYCARNIDGVFKRIAKLKNIYDKKDGETLASWIRDGKEDKILMKNEDPRTFEELKKVVFNTPIPKDSKEKNPFKLHFEKHGKIKKYSKEGNGPEITSVRYIMENLGSHKDISNKYNVDQDKKKIVMLQLKPYRTDFYKCSDGAVKFVTVIYANVFPEGEKFVISEDWYNAEKQRKGIDENATFLCSLQ